MTIALTSTNVIRRAPLEEISQAHSHPFHQIVIGLEGEAEIIIDGRPLHISPFHGCTIPGDREHCYRGIGNNSQLLLDLFDDAPGLSGAYRHHFQLFSQPLHFELDSAARAYLTFMVEEITHQPDVDRDLLITTLLSILSHRLLDRQATPQSRLDLVMLDHYIEQHLARGIRVEDLAGLAHLSSAHFTELFRIRTGLPPYQYILRKRLNAARKLLLESRLPLVDIAERSGFANQSALSHAFRRHFGHSPGALRQTTGS
ncbi:AraC family transcriptional regulator [Kushneria phyllosphaerae]|uniref:HTH-type transcriptional activator RhaS n=1 Tax=Kushneria phyllosphaerae TaxID=2100822 RepID=A0A2R8CKG0_9GAMM|nr:AraC family transcriptional regulator [Kushneria phyllosphaerae]SPJ33361.1 HTH-type transcriptional activator RhaS [Kushneria phyllosphaerae]